MINQSQNFKETTPSPWVNSWVAVSAPHNAHVTNKEADTTPSSGVTDAMDVGEEVPCSGTSIEVKALTTKDLEDLVKRDGDMDFAMCL